MGYLWSEAGVPHRGWSCVGVEDLEEPVGTCEMCGRDDIRYLHLMEHPGYERGVEAGCVCAGKMEEDYEAAKRRERTFKSRAKRREAFGAKQWRRSRSGNLFLKKSGRVFVMVLPKWEGGKVSVSCDGVFSKNKFEHSLQAKYYVFDWLERVKK